MKENKQIKRVYDLNEFAALIGKPRGYGLTDIRMFESNEQPGKRKIGVTFDTLQEQEAEQHD